jgi:tetratricopeptide (TPR) repeat protein
VDDEWESAAKDRQELVKAQASVYRAMGQDTRANALFEELLAQSPEDRDLLRTVAEARLVVGDREGAHELYVRALDIMAADPEISDDRRFKFADRAINNAIRAKLYPDVIALAERAAQWAASSSERSMLARSLARSYFEMEDFDLAVQTLEPVVTDGGLDPTSAEAWQIYYLSLRKIGRDADSQAGFTRFRELQDQ